MRHLTPRGSDQQKATYIISCGLAFLIFIPVLEGFAFQPMINTMVITILALAFVAIAHAAIVTRLPSYEAPPLPRHQPKVGVRQFGETISLSSFAEKRIRQQLLGYEDYVATFEQRKSLLELFVQMEARRRTDIDVKRRGILRQEKGKLSPSSTIYAEAFATILSIIGLGFSLWIGPAQAEDTNGLSLLLIVAGIIATVWNGLRLYIKWSRVYYYRIVGLKKVVAEEHEDGSRSEEQIIAAALVLINKPPFFKGGEVFPLDLSRAQVVKASTFKGKDDPGSWRSNIAGQLSYEGLVVDTYSDEDAPFNWLGPFHNTPILKAEIEYLRTNLGQKSM